MIKIEAHADTQDPESLVVVVEIHADDPAHIERLREICKRWQNVHVVKHIVMAPPDVLRVDLRLY